MHADDQNIIDVRQTAGANLKLVKNVWIHPNNHYREIWNVLITIFLLYNGLVIPVRIAFDLEESFDAFIFDRIIDACFVIDVIINFETGIPNDDKYGETVIMERERVHSLYLRSWFPLDFISSVPLEVILLYGFGISVSGGETRSPKLLRSLVRLVLKSARMARMVKSFRVIKMFSSFEEHSLVGLDTADLIRFIVLIIFMLHWCACIFYYLDNNSCSDGDDRSIFTQLNMEMLPFMDKYVASLYWAMATVLTIGYGDVSALCTATRIFSLFVMFVGTVGYAYGISMVMGMMQKRREQNREFKELMSSVDGYAKFRNLPNGLRNEVKEYFTFVNARNEFIHEKIILDQLTPELRKHVLHHVNHELIQSVSLFRELQAYEQSLEYAGKNLLLDIIGSMKTRVLKPDEIIVEEGEMHSSLFLITKGLVTSYKWGRLKLDTLTDGASFGEACFLSRSMSKLRATKDFRLSISQFAMEKVHETNDIATAVGDDEPSHYEEIELTRRPSNVSDMGGSFLGLVCSAMGFFIKKRDLKVC